MIFLWHKRIGNKANSFLVSSLVQKHPILGNLLKLFTSKWFGYESAKVQKSI